MLLTAVVVSALPAGCRGSSEAATKPDASSTTSTTMTANEPRGACGAAASVSSTVRRLRSATGSVWVWIESSPRPPVHVGALVKVVWRMTGSGPPHAVLASPSGRAGRLAFGPEFHAHSTFVHPGAEYGTGFTATTPGCWRLTMSRGRVEGALAVRVLP